jgi:hypothetical protein
MFHSNALSLSLRTNFVGVSAYNSVKERVTYFKVILIHCVQAKYGMIY